MTYADGYHVDLVIYACWTDDSGVQQYRLAHKDKGWCPADPIALVEFVKQAREPFDGTEDNLSKNDQFRRAVRYQRRWIDEEIPFEDSSKPTGLAFTLLTAERLQPTKTDQEFLPLVEAVRGKMIVLADKGFRRKNGQPENLKICRRGEWNDRMLIETVFSLLSQVCRLKHLRQRVWAYFEMRLAFTVALFNLLQQWRDLNFDENGVSHLSLAEFSL